jgi:hypothetical protein
VNSGETGLTSEPGASYVPESNRTFRMARLMLLMSIAKQDGRRIESIDRLTYYEFFSDNPWAVILGTSEQDSADRDALRLVGFARNQLSYASTGQRFVSRRERIRSDLARLIARGLASLDGGSFSTTPRGDELSDGLMSSYADAYRASSRIVLRRLTRLSNRRLTEQVEDWLGRPWLLLDLLEDVRGAGVPALPEENERLKPEKTRLQDEREPWVSE